MVVVEAAMLAVVVADVSFAVSVKLAFPSG